MCVSVREGGEMTRKSRVDDPAMESFAVESHTRRIEIIPPIFVVSFTLFSPLNINGHMLLRRYGTRSNNSI